MKTKSLTNLVQHLHVYTLEDSLQILAKMPENERLAKIDKIIEDVRKKEEEERQRKQDEMQNNQYGTMAMNQTSGSGSQTGGKWYFYNLNAKGFGQPEFRMRWGNRKLEDNWRRSNKQTLDTGEQNEEAEATDSTSGKTKSLFSNKNREYYLKDIPLNDSSLAASNERLENALFNMGLVYRNDLKDENEAVKTFEEQVRRYPDGPNSLMGYFNLYEMYDLNGNTSKADYYKNLIIRKYPDNPRAKILANPEYVKELESHQNEVQNFYEKTYQEFQNDQYSDVVRDADYAIKIYAGDRTIPRFRLLRALAEGGLKGKEVLKDELQKIITDYPKHEVSDYAKNLIGEIYAMAPELQKADTREMAEQIYTFNPKGSFIIGIAVEKPADVNQMNFNIINFNLDNYSKLNLGIQNETVGTKNILFLRSFTDLASAKRYLQSLNDDADIFKSLNKSDFRPFIISQTNYITSED